MSADTSTSSVAAADAVAAARRREVVDGGIMSFGDHLEELRACSIRALIGLLITTILSLIFAKRILAFVLKPALVVLNAQGQRPELQALSPPDTFLIYLKMSLVAGVILAMPLILTQIWRFVAVGLYSREKRFMRLFTPVSLALFIAGVLFMFFLVLPVVLNFFVTFSKDIRVNDLKLSFLQSWVVGEPDAVAPTRAAELNLPQIPIVATAPEGAPPGSMWFDEENQRFCIQGNEPDSVFTALVQPARDLTAVRSQFSLGQYVGFVLMLSLGFGLAFELPLVVLFITTMGIVSVDTLAKSRRYVIFGIVAAAALLTPPDVISQILLAIPMVVLFEGALLVSRYVIRRRPATAA